MDVYEVRRVMIDDPDNGALFGVARRWWVDGLVCEKPEIWDVIDAGVGPVPERYALLPRSRWDPDLGRWVDE